MADIALPLPTRISQSLKAKPESNETKTRFGNGTEQIVTRGSRPVKYKVSLDYEALNATELSIVESVIAQLRKNPMDRLTYTLPHETTQRKYRIETHEYSYPAYGYTSISIALYEVYL